MNTFESCYNSRYHSDFKSLCERQNESLADFENAIRGFLSEVKNHKMPTRFILHWINKFSDAMNYHFDYNDDYIRTKRKLDKVEDVIREFIDEVKNQDENFEMPKHENAIMRMRMFVGARVRACAHEISHHARRTILKAYTLNPKP